MGSEGIYRNPVDCASNTYVESILLGGSNISTAGTKVGAKVFNYNLHWEIFKLLSTIQTTDKIAQYMILRCVFIDIICMIWLYNGAHG